MQNVGKYNTKNLQMENIGKYNTNKFKNAKHRWEQYVKISNCKK